jgi:hypothetical protein
MRVIGRADDYGVNLLVEFTEHSAKISIPLGTGKLLQRPGRATLVDIAQRNDVLAAHTLEVGRAASARSNDGNVQFVVG